MAQEGPEKSTSIRELRKQEHLVERIQHLDPECYEQSDDERRQERLERYGLDPDEVDCVDLVVGGRMKGTMELTIETFDGTVHKLEPESIDDVKSWLGVEDEAGISCCQSEHEPLPPSLLSPTEMNLKN